MRKYHVIDEDGSEYQVEELDEELIENPKEELEDDEPVINDALSEEEIEALKKLAAIADKLVALTEIKDSDMDEDNLVDEDEDEEVEDSDEDKEEVIDTDEEEKGKTPAHDSKKSFGSLEAKKKKIVEDSSLVDEVSDAWSKRYGGLK